MNLNLVQVLWPPHYLYISMNPSHVFIQQHAVKDGEGLHRMGQFAHHKVNADGVPSLQREDNVEDGQRSRSGFSLCHRVVLQAFRLVASRIHPGHAIIRLRQTGLNLLVLMTRQDGTEEVTSVYGGSENT